MRRWIEDILIGLAAWMILYFTVTHGKDTQGLGQVGEVISEGFVAIMIAYALRVVRLREQVSLLIEHYGELSGVQRKASFALFTPRLKRELDALISLINTGVLVDKAEMEAFVDACFRCCDGAYQGTDSHPPSKFCELYPTYLLKQQRRASSHNLTSDIRFLLVEEDSLLEDYAYDPASVTSFIELHAKKDIRLLQVSPSVAKTLGDGLPATDIGVFGWKYVVFFKPLDSAHRQVYRVILTTLDQAMSARIGGYLLKLNQMGKRIIFRDHAVALVPRGESEVQDCKERILLGYKHAT